MKTLKEKMKTMVGFCSSCGDDILVSVNGKLKKKNNFEEHTIMLSDWSLMRVAVCTDCKKLLKKQARKQEIADTILTNHETFWDKKTGLTAENADAEITEFKREKALKQHKDKMLR